MEHEPLRQRYLRFICFIVGAVGVAAHAASDLVMSVTDSEDPTWVGDTFSYLICVSNVGPDAVTRALVIDMLPGEVVFVSCSVSQGSWTQDSGMVECDLGLMSAAGTALVEIVVQAVSAGVVTNQATLDGDTVTSNNRAAETTTIQVGNRSPTVNLPGPHTLVVGACTSFVVSASDADHDPVILTCTEKPEGATFDGTNFSWCAGTDDGGTTNWITFVADDQQGETNSVVTNRTYIAVPLDYDEDTLSDAWEWEHFGGYGWGADDDPDGDGMANYAEYVAGTEPTNASSAVLLGDVVSSGSVHEVSVPTRGGRRYTIQYADDSISEGWNTFANLGNGIGTWEETNEVSVFTFRDDEGPQTTGGPPSTGRRFYRVKVEVVP